MFAKLHLIAYRSTAMLRDNRARVRYARLVFLLYGLTCAAVALLSLGGLANPGWTVIEEGLGTALFMGSYGLLLILQTLLLVAGYVVLILWLRRAYYNLHQVPGLYPGYSDGWAAGAWFVPFINLWRPYTITREVWNDTQLAALGQVPRPATVLGWWWALYLLKLVAGQVANRLITNDDNFSANDLTLLLVNAVASGAYAFLTWYVIGQVAPFEEQLALRQQVAQLGQPAPPLASDGRANQSDYALPEGY